MTDDPDITIDDFRRFVTAKGGPIQCPHCRDRNVESFLTYHNETDGRSYALLGMNRKSMDLLSADVAWLNVLFCPTCGYLHAILRSVVQKWLAEQGS